MTAQDLIRSVLVLTGALAQGESLSNADAQDAFRRLNRMVSGWKNQRLTLFVTQRNVHSFVGSQASYTIGPGGDWDQARPQFLSYAGLILTATNPDIEIPLRLLTTKDWTFQSVKDITSTLPTALYYETSFPSSGATVGLGRIYAWPVPTQINQVALYCPTAITEFATLTTDYSLPPGYEDALEYGLAVKLIEAGMGLREHLSDMVPQAKEALGLIKRANIQPVTASIDPALWPSRNARPSFNYRTGGTSGGTQ